MAGLGLLYLKKTWHNERPGCWVYCPASRGPRVSHNQAGHFPSAGLHLVPQSCFWRFIFCHLVRPESYFKVSSSPRLPEKRRGRGKKWEGESSKVTFGVSPLELVSSWQGRDSFNFSPTVRSSLFFKRLWDRYKQRKMLPDFSVLSEGHSFLRPYRSVRNGPSVIPAR